MTERVAEQAAGALAGPGLPAVALLAHASRDGAFADFVALGREAGLGVGGRLGMLLHPEYGPWVSLRAALLSARDLPPDAPLAGFDPCTGCAAPCADACPGAAVPPEGFSVSRCAVARAREPACRLRCDARRACVVGPFHAYDAAAEAHHMSRAGVPPAGGGGG
jgi:epoxyqueuosine reductase QueG